MNGTAFPSTHYSKVRTHLPRSELSHRWTAHTSAKETCRKSARGYQDVIYVVWHILLQKNLHPASWTSSTLCPVAFTHAACAEGHSAHSFKLREAALWGGRACCKNLAGGTGVSKQPRPDIYLLLTPAQHFCKSSISQRFRAQPWSDTQLPDSHGASSIPQSWQIPSGLTGTATITAPSMAHTSCPEVLPWTGCCLWAITFVGGLKNQLVFPPFTEAEQLQRQADFHVKRIRGKLLFLVSFKALVYHFLFHISWDLVNYTCKRKTLFHNKSSF